MTKHKRCTYGFSRAMSSNLGFDLPLYLIGWPITNRNSLIKKPANQTCVFGKKGQIVAFRGGEFELEAQSPQSLIG